MALSQNSSKASQKFNFDLSKELKKQYTNEEVNLDLELKSAQSQLSSFDVHSSMRSSIYLNRNSNIQFDDLLQSVNKTEKQITSMEKTIKRIPHTKKNVDSLQVLKDLQSQLIQERQSNYSLQQENEKLRRKVHYKKDCKNNLIILQEDYQTLVESFKRSENIRKKQTDMIKNLKEQLLYLNKFN